VRARETERALIGHDADDQVIRSAAALVQGVLDPPGDVRASRAYRKHIAEILTARALMRALQICRARRIS
jgi:carbon-monoxide dehydrogenase medium subunit